MYTYLASAYPNSALSAGPLVLIALVMAATLAIWLGMVFLAEKSSEKDSRRAHSRLVGMARPAAAAEDKHSGADSGPADQRHGAAA